MRIAVLMGGVSDEREVSLSSGVEVANALRNLGHKVVAVDTVRGSLDEVEEALLLKAGVGALPPLVGELASLEEVQTLMLSGNSALSEIDVFFLALHGGSGEDGTVQAVLEVAGVAYTGSNRLGCSLAMDKEVSKRLLRQAGVPTPDWLCGECSAAEVADVLGLPVIVKAASGGSSLRLVLAHDLEELGSAIDETRGWNDLVLFERYHAGREVTVGILGGQPLPVGEIIPEHEIFDYECKYQPGMAQEIFPANIPPELVLRLGDLAVSAHKALRLRDYSRVDFIIDKEGEPWCLEANALPGMTPNSLLPKAAVVAGVSFPELCERIAELAKVRK